MYGDMYKKDASGS